jgi:hypothetical protein
MQIGLDRLGPHEGLSQADQALIGVDTDPQDIGKLAQAQGLNLGDLH